VYCDEEDNLWVLDAGSPRMEGVLRGDDSGGGAKLVRFSLKTNRVVRPYTLKANVMPRDGYANDVRIDLPNNLAYITDSGTGGIILVDLRHGKTRRIGEGMASLKADSSVVPVVGGRELKKRDGSPFLVHSDGLAFDRKNGWLYYQALTGNRLYRMKTKALQSIMVGADDRLEERVAEATEDLGETVVTDGMAVDDAGNVYFAAIEKNAIMYRTPDGQMHTLVSGEELRWPDSIAIRNGELYFTTSQIHLTDWFTPDGSNPQEPYKVYKVKLPGAAAPKTPG
jgi:sugar lactone lactonase YvrE